MNKTKNNKTVIYKFSSIIEFYTWIKESQDNPVFYAKSSQEKDYSDNPWHGTKTFEEALELLHHGWAPAAEKITARLSNDQNAITRSSQKSFYDMVGGNASVPRYIMGVPTSMINTRKVKVPEKIVVINKDICYSAYWSPEAMLEEGIKALQIIRGIEATGARVKLNIVFGSSINSWSKNGQNILYKICVKQPDQRLNISTMAYPIAHPSFLRRMFFRALEVTPEATSGFTHGYGSPLSQDYDKSKALICEAKEYFIPNKIDSVDKFVADLKNN